MTAYTAPLRDLDFLLHEVLDVARSGIPGYDALDRETTAAIHAEAARLAEEVLAPLNAVGDAEGCRLENGTVRTPTGFADAYRRLAEGGWIALDCDEAHGGTGMPYLMNCTTGEIFVSANMALNMYQGLTHGAISALQVHGTPEQQARYLPPMVAGRWTGTMNLTEPHCGTDLGLIRTKAEPQHDGSYRITGQKIWISGGEQDITENIVHLVLAKIPGGPAGTRGISLFVVPKFLVNDDGSLGMRNGVACVGLESKMGIHGASTCVMAFEGARGWLVGPEHGGLKAMFTMMNEARLGVGLQGYAVAARAHQAAVAFARERLQGRAVGGAQNPGGPADPILVHPDVRRMLMDQRAFVEGARALVLWGAQLIDRAHRAKDADAEALISLLTPVIKSFLTDRGFETCVSAQQVPGGTGYVHGAGFEQFTRDARIAMIYEGTNGIQALDLVGRKLAHDGGKAMMAFFELIRAETRAEADDAIRSDFHEPLRAAAKDLQTAVGVFMETGLKAPEEALAGASDFLRMMGHVCLGLMWARMARTAAAALAAGEGDAAFYRAKLVTGRHYMRRALPETALHLARIRAGAETVMALEAEAF
jgi:alkylation response protein AidB-like acyl-CoA dehydrogenase